MLVSDHLRRARRGALAISERSHDILAIGADTIASRKPKPSACLLDEARRRHLSKCTMVSLPEARVSQLPHPLDERANRPRVLHSYLPLSVVFELDHFDAMRRKGLNHAHHDEWVLTCDECAVRVIDEMQRGRKTVLNNTD